MGIKVSNLTHIYAEGLPDETFALKDVTFELEDGEFVGIIGHTGSGKSTLLQRLNGLLKPKSGKIEVDGVDIVNSKVPMREIRKKIGLVFQYPEYQLFEETVAADVAFGPKNLGFSDEEVRLRVNEAISLVGLDCNEISGKSPFDLSGGQKRRVAIAGVVAMKPQILILDEPTAGLDPQAHREVLEMVQHIHRTEKNITVLVSHNMSDIAEVCDKVIVMNKGQVFMCGTPKEVFSQREKLKEIGLSTPPVSEFLYELAAKDVKIDAVPLNVEEAAETLAKLLK